VAGYDQTAAEFAARWGNLRLERELEAFTRHLRGQRRVVDLGCGPGRDVDFLTQLGCRVVGLDLSLGMLAQARRRMPDARLLRADLRQPPLAARSFDGVWACASLLHLRRVHLHTALAKVARLLCRPGGILYLALKTGHGERWIDDHSGRRSFFVYYQPAEIETALRQAGFEILESWMSPDRAGRDEMWLNFVARVDTV
jgi:SAM-dependent methyltransferase